VNAAAVSNAAISDAASGDAAFGDGAISDATPADAAFSNAALSDATPGGAAFSDAAISDATSGDAAFRDVSGYADASLSPSGEALSTSGQPPRLCLAVRTSLLCEFRTASGVLQAFEVCPGQTTFGVLCSALSLMPGIVFPDHDPLAWFPRPSRFTFRGDLYEVTIPHENIRVCPVEIGKAVIEMEELLEYVRHNVLRQRAARYTIR
jgi:hypothetical protein